MTRGATVSRIWHILRRIDSPRGATLGELADELSCSRKTVARDLDGLQRAGVPLYDEPDGREKRWRLVDGFASRLPPPFTLSELMALYVSRALTAPLAGTPIHDALDDAYRKIGALLPDEARAVLERSDGAFVARTGPFKRYDRHRGLIELVGRAQRDGLCLDVSYRSYARPRASRRRIAPYRLCYYRSGLYVIGHDDRRDEVRTFALERIEQAAASSERFEIPESFDFERYMESALGIFRGPEIDVRVLFRAPVAPAIAEREWHPSQTLEARPDGSVLLSLRVADSLELRRWLLAYGADAEVLEPVSLRHEIRAEARELLDALDRWDVVPDQPFLPIAEFIS